MLLWLYKQISAIRKALSDRDRPEELAWGVALGVWVGLVPKGNLIALCLIAIVLCLRINHAMAAVTAVAVSFLAFALDPFTSNMGTWVLEHQMLQGFFTWSWQQPLVPWTDLNNTIVMGSLILGSITLFPTYSFSLPIFKSLASKASEQEPPLDPIDSAAAVDAAIAEQEVTAESSDEPETLAQPRANPDEIVEDASEQPDFVEADPNLTSNESAELSDEGPRPEIDVIRIRKTAMPTRRVPKNTDHGNDNQEKAA